MTSTLSAAVFFGNKLPEESVPRVTISADAGATEFRHTALLEVPQLLYLLDRDESEGGVTHLGVDVLSRFFATHHDWTSEIAVSLDGQPLDKRLFHKWYGRHQFLVPIAAFRRERHRIALSATAISIGEPAAEEVSFTVEVFLTSKPRIWKEFEKRAIWLFSTARSGSTWLANDVVCHMAQARPVDEPGIGRMFAPLRWDPEYLFDDGTRDFYIESGWAYETRRLPRERSRLPMFERSFANLRQENQILSEHNFDLYHRLLRDVAFEHVLNEWGLLGYSWLVFKMPNDSHAADFIMRACPQSQMIFLMRDGRDVMRSRFSLFASRALAQTADRDLRRYAIAFFSHFWNFQVDIIRSAFEAHAPERRILVKYEDLRSDPANSITRLHRHLGTAFAGPHLKPSITLEAARELAETTRLENFPESERGPDKPRQSGRIGAYRESFDAEEIALMNAIMGPNLRRYGYDVAEPVAVVSAVEPTEQVTALKDSKDEPLDNGAEVNPTQSSVMAVEFALDPKSPVAFLGKACGLSADRWVQQRAELKFRALDAISSVLLEIWVPRANASLGLTLRTAGQPDITRTAPAELVSELRYELHAAASDEFCIELIADREAPLSEIDLRSASYVLNRISFS